MSVEKIAPLGHAATDAAFMRPPGVAGAGRGPPPPAFSPPAATPAEGDAHLYDSLVLPLLDGAPGDDRLFPRELVTSSYLLEAARARIEPLVDGKLPDALLRREVETLLSRVAQARGVEIRRLIEDTPATGPGRLPSRNGKDAQFSIRGRLAALGEDDRPKLFDLYLTRVGARQWEAAAFERDPSRAAHLFPRATPPEGAWRVLLDETSGLVLACVAQQIPQIVIDARPRQTAFPVDWRAVIFTLLAATVTLLAARLVSWRAAAILAAALAISGFAARRRGARVGRAKRRR
jgi:hypothetical protein